MQCKERHWTHWSNNTTHGPKKRQKQNLTTGTFSFQFGHANAPVRLFFFVLVVDDRIAGCVDFLNVAFEIKHFRYNDLEDSLDIDRMGSGTEDERSLHGLGKTDGLFRNVLFLFLLHGGEVVELGANQERECGLIQQPCLLVPVLHGSQRALARKIKHEEQSHGVVANGRQQVEVLLLA